MNHAHQLGKLWWVFKLHYKITSTTKASSVCNRSFLNTPLRHTFQCQSKLYNHLYCSAMSIGHAFLQISHDFALMPVGSSLNFTSSTGATDFADTVYGSPGVVDSWYSVFPVSQQPAWTGRHPVYQFRLNSKCVQASDLRHILLRGLQVLETSG